MSHDAVAQVGVVTSHSSPAIPPWRRFTFGGSPECLGIRSGAESPGRRAGKVPALALFQGRFPMLSIRGGYA
jgi:hypothetical protein